MPKKGRLKLRREVKNNMKKIKLNNKIEMDIQELMRSKLLIQANSGGGKSWTVRRIIEQSHGMIQQIIIDPEGEYANLREKYDFILAGKGGDIPAEPRHAEVLARKLLEHNTSAIIDLYELHPQERKHFVRLFLNAMLNAPKELQHACIVVIDEAHVFAPESGQSEATDAMIGLAATGRKRQFSAIYATQRISKLHKDVAAECNNKLVGRTGLDIDQKRAGDDLGFRTNEQRHDLRNLETGEFYAYGPAISRDVIKFKIGDVNVRPPKANQVFKIPKANSKIKDILKKLGDIPAEAKKELNTIAELKAEIVTLKRDKATSNVPLTSVNNEKIIAEAVKVALNAQELIFWEERNGWLKQIENWFSIIEGIGKTMIEFKKKSGNIIDVYKPDYKKMTDHVQIKSVPMNQKIIMDNGTPKVITGGALRMLRILVSRSPIKLTKTQLATFSQMKSSSGTYGTYLSLLKTNGLIIQEGDLISATQEGISYLGESPTAPLTTEEVINLWRQNLTGGAKRMFDVLVNIYPQSIPRHDLGDAVQMTSSSGSFGTYISTLKSNGLIEIRGQEIKLSDNIFI